MKTLDPKQVSDFVTNLGPALGCDHTYNPIFPEGRRDVCAVRRLAENGRDDGFDTIYLVWANSNGELTYKKIADSRSTKDYISIDSIESKENGSVVVRFSSGGSFSGTPWESSADVEL